MLVDYNNCVVYMLEGDLLLPVAVRGQLEAEGYENLRFELGEGLTGHVAETGKPMLVANIHECEVCKTITGDTADESLASVPLRHGSQVIGAITMSKLGIGQFDEDDLRLLEVVAGHASVAFENARLYASARREAENATAWLEFADAVSAAGSVEAIGNETVRTIARLMEVDEVSMWIEDARAANFRCLASLGYSEASSAPVVGWRAEPATVARLLGASKTPFVVDEDAILEIFGEDRTVSIKPAAIAPLSSGFGVRGWIAVRAPDEDLAHFTGERMRLLEGLSYRASVALRSPCCSSPSRRAPVAGALLEFSRRLAGTETGELRRRIVELAGGCLGSPRTWLWLEAGPSRLVRDRGGLEQGRRSPGPLRSAAWSRVQRRPSRTRGGQAVRDRARDRGHGSGSEDPLAVAPVVLPRGRDRAASPLAAPDFRSPSASCACSRASRSSATSLPEPGGCCPVSDLRCKLEQFVQRGSTRGRRGDIAALAVDAIANAANDHLVDGRRSGWCDQAREGGDRARGGGEGPIAIGDAVATGAGRLAARWVIHAAVMGRTSARAPTRSHGRRQHARGGR
jgi:putative methionine-R-sulfoxide reductase with GAF domain